MYGYILFAALLLVRFGLMALVGRSALPRAAHVAPIERPEKVPFIVYQLTNIAFPALLCFLPIRTEGAWFIPGLITAGLGLVLGGISVHAFARPNARGMCTAGIYRYSRNPMYLAYFVYYLGCVMLTRSIPLLIILILFQAATYWVILSEERWCLTTFGEDYRAYMQSVRRYL